MTVRGILALSVAFGLQSFAQAGPITSFAVTYGGSSSSTSSSEQYGTNAVGAQVGGLPPSILTNTVTGLNITLGTGGPTSSVTLAASSGGAQTFSINGTTATFTFFGPTAVSAYSNPGSPTPPSFSVVGNGTTAFAYLSSVDPDFGPEFTIFAFSLTFNGLAISGTTFTPGATTASGTFTSTGQTFNPNDLPPGVPEPTTLATFGLMALFGGGYLTRRKLKAAAVAQA